MKLSFLFFGSEPNVHWKLVKQMGIKYAIAKLAPEITSKEPPYNLQSLEQSLENYHREGLELIGLEGDQFDMGNIKQGLAGRDRDIDHYCQMLENMGRLNVKLLCYNFMVTGWYRTDKKYLGRGGAIVTGFDLKHENSVPIDPSIRITSERLWENYQYFIDRVMPVAESAGVKMALHPDDPPVTPLRGIGRIFTSGDDIRKALALSPSASHGLTFCQGTYTTMGEDVKALLNEWGSNKKIHFVHIRDIRGNRDKFLETFHDDGPTNMATMFNEYKKIGYEGPLRSDHVPTMEGEDNSHPGYGMKGNLFGIGYIKGIMDTLNINYQ